MTMLDSDHKIRGSIDFINQHVGFRRWRYFKVKSGFTLMVNCKSECVIVGVYFKSHLKCWIKIGQIRFLKKCEETPGVAGREN